MMPTMTASVWTCSHAPGSLGGSVPTDATEAEGEDDAETDNSGPAVEGEADTGSDETEGAGVPSEPGTE